MAAQGPPTSKSWTSLVDAVCLRTASLGDADACGLPSSLLVESRIVTQWRSPRHMSVMLFFSLLFEDVGDEKCCSHATRKMFIVTFFLMRPGCGMEMTNFNLSHIRFNQDNLDFLVGTLAFPRSALLLSICVPGALIMEAPEVRE